MDSGSGAGMTGSDVVPAQAGTLSPRHPRHPGESRGPLGSGPGEMAGLRPGRVLAVRMMDSGSGLEWRALARVSRCRR